MYYVSSGKINRSELCEEAAAAPYHVSQRIVDEKRPEYYKEKECLKLHPACDSACYERRGYKGEHHLERREQQRRYAVRVSARFPTDVIHEQRTEAAYYSAMVSRKCERVSDSHPHNGAHAHYENG